MKELFSLPFPVSKGLGWKSPSSQPGDKDSSGSSLPTEVLWEPVSLPGCRLPPSLPLHSSLRPPRCGDVFPSSSLEAAPHGGRWHGSLTAGAGRAKADASRAGFGPCLQQCKGWAGLAETEKHLFSETSHFWTGLVSGRAHVRVSAGDQSNAMLWNPLRKYRTTTTTTPKKSYLGRNPKWTWGKEWRHKWEKGNKRAGPCLGSWGENGAGGGLCKYWMRKEHFAQERGRIVHTWATRLLKTLWFAIVTFKKCVCYLECKSNTDFKSTWQLWRDGEEQTKEPGCRYQGKRTFRLSYQGKNAGLQVQITEFPKYKQLVSTHPAAPADDQNTLWIPQTVIKYRKRVPNDHVLQRGHRRPSSPCNYLHAALSHSAALQSPDFGDLPLTFTFFFFCEYYSFWDKKRLGKKRTLYLGGTNKRSKKAQINPRVSLHTCFSSFIFLEMQWKW